MRVSVEETPLKIPISTSPIATVSIADSCHYQVHSCNSPLATVYVTVRAMRNDHCHHCHISPFSRSEHEMVIFVHEWNEGSGYLCNYLPGSCSWITILTLEGVVVNVTCSNNGSAKNPGRNRDLRYISIEMGGRWH